MKNKIRVLVALACIVALVATGTFAWEQTVSKKNEFFGKHSDSTLHDDFDGKNKKDVYVENTGGVTLYVRVKLEEAMNIGNYKWRPASSADWFTHIHGATAEDCGNSNHQGNKFHDYFTWIMGGQKWYMPAGSGQPLAQDVNNYNENTPGAKQTPYAQIISAAEFLEMGEEEQKAFVGWIMTSDGYAYWSQPLKEGQATGLLLNGVGYTSKLKNKSYYYVINVIAEVVDIADIPMWKDGADPNEGGDKHPEASVDGKEVIDIILGNEGGDEPGEPGEPGNGGGLLIDGGNKNIGVGDDLQLTYTVNPEGFEDGKTITWESGDTDVITVDADGKIHGAGEGTTTITLTISDGDETKTSTILVTVTDGSGGVMPPNPEIPLKTGPFVPITNNDPMHGDGYYAKVDFMAPGDPNNNQLYHTGSVHLEEIIADGNYNVTVEAVNSKYAPYIQLGACGRHEDKPSIIFSYQPTNAELVAYYTAAGDINALVDIPVEVRLTRGEKHAVITIHMIYPDCIFALDI